MESFWQNIPIFSYYAMDISHKNVKLYCHYFNNRRTCPYDEECLFLHEFAGICKFGGLCERILCMFEHGDGAEANVIDVNEEESVTREEIIDVDEQEEFMEQENETSERTFINPSQDDKVSSDEMIKCEMCDFASARKTELMTHKELDIIGAIYVFQESLKNHFKKMHNNKGWLAGPQTGEAPR